MNKPMILGALAGSKDQLKSTFEAVPDDKLHWRPLDQGRSAIDLAGDAAQTPVLAMRILQMAPDAPMPPMREAFGQMREERQSWSKADVLQHLEANHSALCQAVEAMSEEQLAEPLAIPMGPDFTMTLPRAGWAMMSHRAYVSRFAQINYIQTLYGDMEGH